MVKAILLDVDGVIVGEKVGFNSPYPHLEVLHKLKNIHASGIAVVLCTGKTLHSVQSIIKDCKLNNPHITDCGAIITDPLENKEIKIDTMDSNLVQEIVKAYLAENMYIEAYAKDRYLIQKNQFRENLTPVHSHILLQEPVIVDSLMRALKHMDIIRLLPIAIDENDAVRLDTIFETFKERASLTMGTHPIANPHKFGVITSKNISKKQAALEMVKAMNIPLSEFLGIGDSTSDWQFMELCGYVGAVGNASDELKKLVKKNKQGFVSKQSVDENGILPILDHFLSTANKRQY